MHSMPNAIKYFRIIFLQRKGYTYMKKKSTMLRSKDIVKHMKKILSAVNII